ncbi:MAG: M20 family metallo-hydrolase [Deltaproteobacteria bacterium]|nr:M20 family metallo-hydrolase [Deltaproteobacteria bacterium]
MNGTGFDTVAAKIDGYRDEVIKLERLLTAIPALSPKSGGKGELAKCRALEQYLRGMGLTDLTRIDAPDPDAEEGIRPNLIARIPGASNERTVWVMSHLDIVPEGDLKKWDSPPFEIRIDGDKIYGRGVEDNQQGIVASTLAARALLETGTKPAYDVALLFVADEETGSELGIQYLLKKNKGMFRPADIVIVPDGGLPDGTMIEVAEKGIVWIKVTTQGKQCHGSTPEKGINAHVAAAHTIVRLRSLYKKFGARDEVFDPPISTFEPTKKDANVPNVNTIPGEDVFYIDCRVLPQYDIAKVLRRVKTICGQTDRKFGTTTTLDTAQRENAAPPTPADAPVVLSLLKAVQRVYGVQARPMGIGGGTVAAHIRRAGVPVAVWARMDETMHGPNEYAIIPNLLGDAKVLAHVMLQA